MRIYRYPLKTLIGDYIRSACGVLLGAGVFLSVPLSPLIVIVFGIVLVLFTLFAVQTILRHITQVALTDDEICAARFGTVVLPWRDLERVKLRYYGSRPQSRPKGGFMQLTLKGGGASLRLESHLDGFEDVARHAAMAARENRISLDPTSAGNFLAFGLDPDCGTETSPRNG